MATNEIVKPHEIVKANNGLFRCKYKIKDVLAARIFMAFASLVDHKDVQENQSFVEYHIPASSVIDDIDAGGDYYNQLRGAAYSLVDHKIEQRFEKKNFAVYTLFSKIEYRDGIIKGEFHKDLMPFFLIAKERFTKMKLGEFMQLPSIYSQFIFSFLKSWDDKPEITVKLSELHDMLDTPKTARSNFAEFKRRILDKAHKDINENTSLKFEFEAIKNGRAVSEIKFIFLEKTKKHAGSNPRPGPFLQEVLGESASRGQTVNAKYEAFLAQFPDGAKFRVKAGSMWHDLYNMGRAPLAKDVNGESDPVAFLKAWRKTLDKKQEEPRTIADM